MGSVVQNVLAQAWHQFAGQCLLVLPNLIASLLFLLLGLAVMWVAGKLARALLGRTSVERRASRMGLLSWLERAGIYSVTAPLARVVQVVIGLLTVGLMLYALDPVLAADLTKRFFLYLPQLAVGATIFVLGLVAARFTERRVLIGAVNRGVRPARLLASLIRGGIVLLSTAVALDHLGIGRTIVPGALLIVLGSVALTTSIAVGFGSRDLVRRWLEDRMAEPPAVGAGDVDHW
jgi:hypothetical protein